jgi:multicomponent Na+:H+ antiporter subunit E
MTSRTVVVFVLLCVVWLLWSGLTIEVTPGGSGLQIDGLLAGLGLGSVGLVVWLSQRMRVLDPEGQPFHLTWRIVAFLPWLFGEVWKSNIAVAKVILARKVHVRPRLYRVTASQRSIIGQVIHANTITITPGTITLDLRGGELLVHALTDSTISDSESRAIDDRIAQLEGAPAKAKEAP